MTLLKIRLLGNCDYAMDFQSLIDHYNMKELFKVTIVLINSKLMNKSVPEIPRINFIMNKVKHNIIVHLIHRYICN